MKLQSLDSKAIKLALGIPVHATILGAYREAGIFPLDEMRKLAAAAYIRNSIVANHTNTETELMSDKPFSKSSNKNLSVNHSLILFWLFEKIQLNCRKVAKQMIYSPTPEWEPMKADFDKEHTEMKKEDNPHILIYI